MRRVASILSAVAIGIVLLLPASGHAAAAGEPDPTFAPWSSYVRGTAGESESFTSIASMADGRVVASSWLARLGVDEGRIDRFHSSGQVDTSFSGGDGYETPSGYYVADLAVRSDGSIVFVGSHGPSGNGFIGRLTPQGDLDTAFAADAPLPGLRVITREGGYSLLDFDHVAIDASGRIVAVGTYRTTGGDDHVGIVRLLADGTVDTSFHNDTDDVRDEASGVGNDWVVNDLVALDGGSLLAVGLRTGGSGLSLFGGIRGDGQSSFTEIDLNAQIGTQYSAAFGAAPARDEHYGYVVGEQGSAGVLARVRVPEFGTPTPLADTSFSDDGMAELTGLPAVPMSIVRTRAGRYLVAGISLAGAPTPNRLVTRLTSTGAVDTAFGTNGVRQLSGHTNFSFLNLGIQGSTGPNGTALFAGSVLQGAGRAPFVERLVDDVVNISMVARTTSNSAPGALVTSTFEVRNTGPDDARDVSVRITAGPGVMLDRVDLPDASTCPIAAGVATCTFTSVMAGQMLGVWPTQISVRARGTVAGSPTITAVVSSGSHDASGTTDDTAVATLKVQRAQQRLTLKQLVGRTLQTCGTVARPCATRKIRRGVRTVPFVTRTTAQALPPVAGRKVTFTVQRKVGRRWVPVRGSFTAKLSASKLATYPLPSSLRTFTGTFRIRATLPVSTTVAGASSNWLYVRSS